MSPARTCAIALVLAGCSGEDPKPVDAAPAAASRAPAKLGLPLRVETEHFRLYGDLDLDFRWLANVCEETRNRIRLWLEIPDEAPESDVDLFLVGTHDEVAGLERALGSSGDHAVVLEAGGGYYHEERTILIAVTPERRDNLEWFVCHETCHAVLRAHTRKMPVVVSEGLAEVLPSWILHEDDLVHPEAGMYRYDDYAARCARLVREGRVPSCVLFLQINRKAFRANRADHYALAWSLVLMLMTSRHPEIAGKLPHLIREYAGPSHPWRDFQNVYDRDLVARLWEEELARMADTRR